MMLLQWCTSAMNSNGGVAEWLLRGVAVWLLSGVVSGGCDSSTIKAGGKRGDVRLRGM